MGTEPAKAEIMVKRAGLGVRSTSTLRARDEAAETDLPIADDKLTVEVPPGSFRLVSVQKQTADR